MKSYQTVPDEESAPMMGSSRLQPFELSPGDGHAHTKKKDGSSGARNLLIVLGALFVSMVLLNAMLRFNAAPVYQAKSPEQQSSCRPCEYEECQRNNCDATESYVCVSGTSRDGCSPDSTAWTNTSDCKECCDASKCSSTKPKRGKVYDGCDVCSKSECETFSHKCPKSSPYVCVNGSAVNGCSADSGHWPNALNGNRWSRFQFHGN